MRLWRTHSLEDITLVRGQGCTVWDAAGKPYLDLLSGTWCNVLGYGHPRWVEAIQSQVSKLAHIGAPFPTEEVGEALSKLGEVLPPALNRAVFLNTGSEAVELALKMAHAATGAERLMTVVSGLDAWPKCGRMCIVEFNVDIRARRHYVAMGPSLLKRLRQVAQACGLSAGSLIDLWSQEHLTLQRA